MCTEMFALFNSDKKWVTSLITKNTFALYYWQGVNLSLTFSYLAVGIDELSPDPIPALLRHLELCLEFVDLSEQRLLGLLEVLENSAILDLVGQVLHLTLTHIPANREQEIMLKVSNLQYSLGSKLACAKQ